MGRLGLIDGITEGFSDPKASHGGWRWNLSTREIEWSPGTYRIHGVSPSNFEPTVESVRELIHPDDVRRYAESVQEAIRTRAPFTVEHRIIRPDGSLRILVVRGSFLPGSNGNDDAVVGTTEDISERERAEDRLWHMANHDSLTNLYNRRRLFEEIERELAVARRTGQPGALVMLDLDDFKAVNDILGHLAGDTVLVRVGDALRGRLRTTDALARLGGDEFAVILPDCSLDDARTVASDLLAAVTRSASVDVAGRRREVTVSAGIAPFGDRDGYTPDGLLVEADLAMYRAKAKGGAGVEVFDEEMRGELAERLVVEGDLKHALEDDELTVFYQPIVSLVDGGVVGCEALVRWLHPSRGLLNPADFIPIAEERGLLGRVGLEVLKDACRQAHAWRSAGKQLYVSVNVSPLQLLRDDVAASVKSVLADTGLPAQLLCLEVTETSLIEDVTKLTPTLADLHDLGVRIAIDDFGGGASALRFLSALPIDIIKIDRMFVQGVRNRPHDRAIVAAVMSMAEEMELTVIGEGVETEGQQGDLRELGCPYAQGFLYSEPRPADQLHLDGYSAMVQPGVGDPSVVREFMRQIGIPAARMS